MHSIKIIAPLSLSLLLLSSCVQETYKRTLVFSVDTRNETDIQSIGVRGNFPPLNWDEDLRLTDNDQDSVYEGEIILDTPYEFVQLKFVKNGQTFELNDQPNRKVYFKDQERIEFKAVFDQANSP